MFSKSWNACSTKSWKLVLLASWMNDIKSIIIKYNSYMECLLRSCKDIVGVKLYISHIQNHTGDGKRLENVLFLDIFYNRKMWNEALMLDSWSMLGNRSLRMGREAPSCWETVIVVENCGTRGCAIWAKRGCGSLPRITSFQRWRMCTLRNAQIAWPVSKIEHPSEQGPRWGRKCHWNSCIQMYALWTQSRMLVHSISWPS